MPERRISSYLSQINTPGMALRRRMISSGRNINRWPKAKEMASVRLTSRQLMVVWIKKGRLAAAQV